MSLEDNKHALYQLLAHPKYVGNLILCNWIYLASGIRDGEDLQGFLMFPLVKENNMLFA